MPTDDFTLTGDALKKASPEDAERLSQQCEQVKFYTAQKIGYQWKPTRQVLIDHIRYQMDEEDRVDRHMTLLSLVSAIQGLAIILALIRIWIL